MTHRSRLCALIVDCRTDDLDVAAAFWRARFCVGQAWTRDFDARANTWEGEA